MQSDTTDAAYFVSSNTGVSMEGTASCPGSAGRATSFHAGHKCAATVSVLFVTKSILDLVGAILPTNLEPQNDWLVE